MKENMIYMTKIKHIKTFKEKSYIVNMVNVTRNHKKLHKTFRNNLVYFVEYLSLIDIDKVIYNVESGGLLPYRKEMSLLFKTRNLNF